MTKQTESNKHKQENKEQKTTRTEKKQEQSNKKQKKYVRRLIPVWAKLLIIIMLSLLALIIGLMIGYSILGDGNPLDVLKLETWQHILDFVRGNEE